MYSCSCFAPLLFSLTAPTRNFRKKRTAQKDERFKILSADYEKEQRSLRTEMQSLQKQMAELDSKTVNIESFLKMAHKYTSFEELTPGMLHDLIEKIVIHERDKSSGHREQRVDIYYTFIGTTDGSQVVARLKRKGEAA